MLPMSPGALALSVFVVWMVSGFLYDMDKIRKEEELKRRMKEAAKRINTKGHGWN